jgi:hypothetical protein
MEVESVNALLIDNYLVEIDFVEVNQWFCRHNSIPVSFFQHGQDVTNLSRDGQRQFAQRQDGVYSGGLFVYDVSASPVVLSPGGPRKEQLQ